MKIPYINIYFKSLYVSTYNSISGAVARYQKVHTFQMRFLLGFFLSCGDELLSTFKQDSVGYLYHLQTAGPLPIYICAQHMHSFLWYVLHLVLQSKYFCRTRAISYRVEWKQQTKVNSRTQKFAVPLLHGAYHCSAS